MPFVGTALLLRNTCTIQRRTSTKNNKNQKTFSAYANLSTGVNIKCRLIPKSGSEQLNDKWITVIKYILYLPFGTDITEDDQVVIGTDKYIVNWVNENPGNSDHHIEVEVKKIED